MQYFKLSVVAALAASVSALQVTQPASMASIDVSKKNEIQWTTVSTDASSFSIQLVNMAVNPSVTINIADNVQTSAKSYTFGPLNNVAPGADYQINLVSVTPQNTGILAQSGQFSVTSSGGSTTSVSFSSSTPPTASSTGTSGTSTSSSGSMTTTTSGSSSGSSSSSSTASKTSSGSSSGSGSATVASSSGAATQTGNTAAGVHAASGLAGLGFVAMVAALFA